MKTLTKHNRIMISDMVREAIYFEESEHFELYNEDERNEFLYDFYFFKIFFEQFKSNVFILKQL